MRGTGVAALGAIVGVLAAPGGAWAAPAFTGALPADPSNATEARFAFTAGDPATASCRLDGAEVVAAPCPSPLDVTGLQDGRHELEVSADGATVSHRWTVDTAAPETTMTAGPTGVTAEPSASFVFESSEPRSTFVCRFDAGPWAPCTSPHEVTEYGVGSHKLSVRAIDPAGNEDVTEAYRAFELRPAGGGGTGGGGTGGGTGGTGGTTGGPTGGVDAGDGGEATSGDGFTITGTPTSGAGSAAGLGGVALAAFDLAAPRLTGLTAPRLRLGRRVVLRWRLSERAQVTLRIERRSVRRGRVRWIAVPGTMRADGVLGDNGRAFRGRIGTRVLRRGTYRVVARAQDSAGNRSPLVRAGFRVTG